MKLNNIDIQNFRCYKNTNIELGKHITILIGKNGSGKSSVLSAIRKGLSFIFSESKEEINPLKANNNTTVSSIPILDTRYDESEGGFIWPTSIKYEIDLNSKLIQWEFYKKSDPGGLHSTLYKNARDIIIKDLIDNPEKWPVYAFFGDSFPHLDINLGSKSSRIIKSDILPKDFAYYGWDAYQNCNVLWQSRFKYIDNIIFSNDSKVRSIEDSILRLKKKLDSISDKNEISKFKSEILELENSFTKINQATSERTNLFEKEKGYIESKFIKFTEPLNKEYNFINKEFEVLSISALKLMKSDISVKFLLSDTRSIISEMLPMGYKRLFNIVFDLAYRSYIISNGVYEPTGIVMIDEIELHLHPSLQQEVLQRFIKTFPNIQFIVTTHSPLVISNFKADENNKIIKLENNGNEYWNESVENVYGIDYGTNLAEIMEVEPRSSTIDKFINAYLFLIDKNNNTKADEMLEKLEEYLGTEIPSKLQEEIDSKKSKL
ncbi:AAA family ATPase [Algoriphagus sp. D3-2-R+10]|uniref:AAA family ATPase n=1 Tax=Algoriphagus aurantiacus TaxID=3103948 RepID=UPI002B3FB6F1|nr:AAA family ATPase [Algoriphagus sp. D3-2-R+10]MEB2778089.1 AAA family ATPase [Algoriphagus sp. D3-2-R+10]